MTLSASPHPSSGIELASQAFVPDAAGVETSCDEWDNEGTATPSAGSDLQSRESRTQKFQAANGSH